MPSVKKALCRLVFVSTLMGIASAALMYPFWQPEESKGRKNQKRESEKLDEQRQPEGPIYPKKPTHPKEPMHPEEPIYPKGPIYPNEPVYPEESIYAKAVEDDPNKFDGPEKGRMIRHLITSAFMKSLSEKQRKVLLKITAALTHSPKFYPKRG